ncbi:proton-dependent oligopeptide transporter, POT family [Fodinibius roseus]|uniref:Proton-dependent oligopeptide transporter, POT family n=1 Tax=Fodinibius roseus TaxID=1194090 RepID=A0A1M5AFV6_9BACT|nr:peptide MFS transporter [Fodinibius roseus]SHF29014.1 proton-dependent oligopeptide transporter, POT family [Fodinibius roseus]
MANEQSGSVHTGQKNDFFGHPRGLSTLFFTELWERFSYYGMRALLVLFMTAEAMGNNPGLGFSVGKATAIYGLYTFFVYVLSLPGGWVADKLWGQRKAVFVGGCIIAAGHFSMAVPTTMFFYIGLALIVIGTGLLKPNVSSMVGDLYPEGGARRDAGFSIFYMGINFGAILGPLLCGLLGEGYNWHYGFSLAGFGMVLGLISYKYGYKFLGNAGDLKTGESREVLNARSRRFYTILSVTAGAIVAFTFLMSSGVINITLQTLAEYLGGAAVTITILFFGYIIFFGGHTREEQKKLGVIFWLFILAALFWSGFEQAGSSLNLFAQDLTNRSIGDIAWLDATTASILTLLIAIPVLYMVYRVFNRKNLWDFAKWVVGISSVGILIFIWWLIQRIGIGWETPASTLQLINPFFIVVFAPIFGWLWTWLASKNANPSIPVKFGLGLFGLAAGFFVLSWGAVNATEANPVSPSWLIVTYFLHTCGELCLSPVGLSSMTKLAPQSRVSQMMGIWFVAAAVGNLFAGLLAGQLETLAPTSLFWWVAMIVGGGGIVALIAAPPVKKLMGDVE